MKLGLFFLAIYLKEGHILSLRSLFWVMCMETLVLVGRKPSCMAMEELIWCRLKTE